MTIIKKLKHNIRPHIGAIIIIGIFTVSSAILIGIGVKDSIRVEKIRVESRMETYNQWIDQMGYDFTYPAYQELKLNKQLPTTPIQTK